MGSPWGAEFKDEQKGVSGVGCQGPLESSSSENHGRVHTRMQCRAGLPELDCGEDCSLLDFTLSTWELDLS